MQFKEKEKNCTKKKQQKRGQRGCPPSTEARNLLQEKGKIKIMIQEDFIFFSPSLIMTPSIWNLKKDLLRRCYCWSDHLKLSHIPEHHTGWVPEIIPLWSCYSHAQGSDCLERQRWILYSNVHLKIYIDLKYCPHDLEISVHANWQNSHSKGYCGHLK